MALSHNRPSLRPAHGLLLLVIGLSACTHSRDDAGPATGRPTGQTPSSTPLPTPSKGSLTQTLDVEGVTVRTPAGWTVNSREDCVSESPFERKASETCPGIAFNGSFLPGGDPDKRKQRQPADPCHDTTSHAESVPREVRLEHESALTATFVCDHGRGQSWVVPYADVQLSVAPQPNQQRMTAIVATVQDLRHDTTRGPDATEHAVIYDVVVDVPVSWRKVDESEGGCVGPEAAVGTSADECRGITYSLSDEPPVAGTATLFASVNRYGCDSKGALPTQPTRLEVMHGIDVVHQVCPSDETYVLHGEFNSKEILRTARHAATATAAAAAAAAAVRSMRRLR